MAVFGIGRKQRVECVSICLTKAGYPLVRLCRIALLTVCGILTTVKRSLSMRALYLSHGPVVILELQQLERANGGKNKQA